MCQLLDFEN